MIRESDKNDIAAINNIGMLINHDFSHLNHLNERLDYDYVRIFVFEENNIIKGFIEIERHFEITDIINIAVLEEYQKSGIASSLINYVISNIEQKKIMLEVSENNTKALNFYKKNNFVEINRRKKYYDNLYDAIIMEREVI